MCLEITHISHVLVTKYTFARFCGSCVSSWFNPLTPEDAKSKVVKCSKITKNQKNRESSTAQWLSNEWSHFMGLPMESKLEDFVSAEF